jgi:hypothetical protein
MTQDIFSQIALDALLHGLRYLRDAADKTIQEVEHTRNGVVPPRVAKQARGLLEKGGKRPSGWSADPAERKREMKRRIAKRKATGKPMGGAAIKDKEKWRENVREAAKAAWERLTPAERKAKVARIAAGRRKAA